MCRSTIFPTIQGQIVSTQLISLEREAGAREIAADDPTVTDLPCSVGNAWKFKRLFLISEWYTFSDPTGVRVERGPLGMFNERIK